MKQHRFKTISNSQTLIIALLGFSLIGLTALQFSRAATAVISAEPDSGMVSNGASIVSDATASEGKTVKFAAAAPPTGSKVISRSVPAFASSGTASSANDASYGTTWKSSGASAWLAYDLSKVAEADRNRILLAWYNDATGGYDYRLDPTATAGINFPRNYTIETNTAAGGGSVPASGWTSKATVSENYYHSRQHVIDMAGSNWVRINVSAVRGSLSDLNLDVLPAEAGLANSWIFYGSSTPSIAMSHKAINSTASFSEQINQARPAIFPVQESGSVIGLSTIEGKMHIDTWLSVFPGRYVTVGLGANDAMDCVSATSFYSNLEYTVTAIKNAGKVAIVPTFNWSSLANSCGPGLITKLNELYANHPHVLKGPDFWTYYKNNPSMVSSDNIHPTTAGMAQFRKMWVDWALANIYK